MPDNFNPEDFREKRSNEKAKREASAAARVVPAAMLLSGLIAICLIAYRYIT